MTIFSLSPLLFIAALSCVFPALAAPEHIHLWNSPQTIRREQDISKVVRKMSAGMYNAVLLNIKGEHTPDELFKDLNRRCYFDYATAYWYEVSNRVRLLIEPADSAVLAAAFHQPALKKRLSKAERKALKVAMDCVKRSVTPSMTRPEKVKALHDAIAEMCDYDHSNTENQSAVSVLLRGKGACGAYARTLWLMLDMQGIPCHIIQGCNKDAERSPHAWAIVQMDDNAWFHVDVCKDDADNVLTYRFFAVTDEEMARYHDWDKSSYPSTPSAKRAPVK